ncbi:MAG: hypothetical protein L6Q98_09425 [Anaerolineae bacterium]|nr:hypothetical protein [Anaerolineae bacterium]NUQ06608.1 hypothetical protein [Anaerolineae bacterium]
MRRASLFIAAVCAFLLLSAAHFQGSAAQVAESCPAFVANALNTVGNNCGGLERNNACYGYNTVEAEFLAALSELRFQHPADRADLASLARITTSPMQTPLNEWGIALMSVQANLPDALPGQNVVFMLLGDSEIENAVAPDDTEHTPMQAFYFRTSAAGTECLGAPDSLIVQGPRGLKVDITANGADIRIGSTIALRSVTPTDEIKARLQDEFALEDEIVSLMEVTTLDGEAILNPDTPQEQHVPAGSRAYRCLTTPDDLGMDGAANDNTVLEGCPWTAIEEMENSEIAAFDLLEDTLLNYPIELPYEFDATPTETVAPEATPVSPTWQPPTETPTPTFTFTTTFTPLPTSTLTPSHTFTPLPTDTLMPSHTPLPTNTPLPTETLPPPTETPLYSPETIEPTEPTIRH